MPVLRFTGALESWPGTQPPLVCERYFASQAAPHSACYIPRFLVSTPKEISGADADPAGQVIVIGATNRPDSVDPALRRPGRFDREFYFPLPNKEARKKIIKINTRVWDPPLEEGVVEMLAGATKGYGGADMRVSTKAWFWSESMSKEGVKEEKKIDGVESGTRPK